MRLRDLWPYDPGFYGPGSMTWRLNREAAVLLAGPRALLMQIAHPAVAAGVLQHSQWDTRPYRRLWRTLWLMHRTVFAPRRRAEQALRSINRRHTTVTGTYSFSGHPDISYDARDPELAWWVLATLIDSTLHGYERWVAPLTDGQRQQFYQESRETTHLFGVDSDDLPADFAAFRTYMATHPRELDRELPPEVKRLARGILGRNRLITRYVSGLAISGLPERFRRALDFDWPEEEQRRWTRWDRRIRRLNRLLPLPLRYNPIALLARHFG